MAIFNSYVKLPEGSLINYQPPFAMPSQGPAILLLDVFRHMNAVNRLGQGRSLRCGRSLSTETVPRIGNLCEQTTPSAAEARIWICVEQVLPIAIYTPAELVPMSLKPTWMGIRCWCCIAQHSMVHLYFSAIHEISVSFLQVCAYCIVRSNGHYTIISLRSIGP